MKFSTCLVVLSIMVCLVSCKLKLVIKEYATNKSMLRQSTAQTSSTKPVYVTLIEGSKETYAMCNSICREKGEPDYYTEVTNFPGYGDIFRCQCGGQYTTWYNLENGNELCIDILLGDTLFNHYLNLLGYDTDNCHCDALKQMLARLID